MLYRFIGDVARLRIDGQHIDLTYFGQEVDMTEDQARGGLGSPVVAIPDSEFQALGFTPDELEKYSTSVDQRSAPATFLAKKQRALELFTRELLAGRQHGPAKQTSIPATQSTDSSAQESK